MSDSDANIPKVFNPDEVLLELFGHECEGFAEGTLIEFDDNEDSIKAVVGTTGEVAISRVFNPLGVLTVRLLQTSATNDVLSAQRNLTANGVGISGSGPMALRDMNGRTQIDGRALVMKPPKIVFAETAKEREWKILVVKTKRVDGGNNQLT